MGLTSLAELTTLAELKRSLGLNDEGDKSRRTREDRDTQSIAEDMRPTPIPEETLNGENSGETADTDDVHTKRRSPEKVRHRQFVSYVGVVTENRG